MARLLDIMIVLIVLGLAYGFWYAFFGGASRKQMQKRVEQIRSRKATHKAAQEQSLRRKTDDNKGIVYLLMKPLPDFKRLGDRLERAGKNISAKKYILRCLLATFGIIFVISVVLKKPLMLGVAVGIMLGIWLPFKALGFSISKQNKAFLRSFPDALDLIVRGLRSGLPVSESLVLVSTEVPDPVGSTFRNVSNTMKLGVTMEKALLETAKKLDMTEFNFFTTSIVLQRETGGNLSEILNNLSEVLRGRYMMRMKIKAMSSEARASAYIIGALPFVVMLAVSVLSPQYMQPLWHDVRGNICLGVAGGMMFGGGWIMARMTKFEI